jgi:hypothetical protein
VRGWGRGARSTHGRGEIRTFYSESLRLRDHFGDKSAWQVNIYMALRERRL